MSARPESVRGHRPEGSIPPRRPTGLARFFLPGVVPGVLSVDTFFPVVAEPKTRFSWATSGPVSGLGAPAMGCVPGFNCWKRQERPVSVLAAELLLVVSFVVAVLAVVCVYDFARGFRRRR